jgi:hypothetical protein
MLCAISAQMHAGRVPVFIAPLIPPLNETVIRFEPRDHAVLHTLQRRE